MNATSTQLLRMLGSGVRPDSVIASAPAQAGQTSFADLLRQARDGSLTSNTPVTIASDAEIALTDDQLARLSLGADKLEAAGVRVALVSIDGKQYVLDVHSREITGEAKPEHGVIAGIDGVLDLGDARASAAVEEVGSGATTARAPQTPAGLAQNQSLMKLLADLSGA